MRRRKLSEALLPCNAGVVRAEPSVRVGRDAEHAQRIRFSWTLLTSAGCVASATPEHGVLPDRWRARTSARGVGETVGGTQGPEGMGRTQHGPHPCGPTHSHDGQRGATAASAVRCVRSCHTSPWRPLHRGATQTQPEPRQSGMDPRTTDSSAEVPTPRKQKSTAE
jgi:hypothetical protein